MDHHAQAVLEDSPRRPATGPLSGRRSGRASGDSSSGPRATAIDSVHHRGERPSRVPGLPAGFAARTILHAGRGYPDRDRYERVCPELMTLVK